MADKRTPHYDTNFSIKTQQKDEPLHPTVQYVKDCWEQWNQHWSSKFTEFESYYDRWMGKAVKRDEDWQSTFHKRLTWQAEKVLNARYHSALFPNSAPIDVDATEAVDEFEGLLGKSMVSHWFKKGRISKEFLSGMRPAAIYGTGMFEDGWLLKTEVKRRREEVSIPDFRAMTDEFGNKVFKDDGSVQVMKVGEKRITQEVDRREIVEDRYRVEKTNIFAWRIHPHKLSDEDDYPVIKQEFITYEDLLKRQKELEKYGLGGFSDLKKIKDDKFKIDEADAKRIQKEGEYFDKKNPRLEVLTYWGPYSEDENADQKPMVLMIVNRKYRVKVGDNPFWHKKPPLFHIVWTEDVKDSYYGIGIAQIGADAEDRANSAVNIRIDMKKKNVKGTGWYNATDKKIKKSQVMNTTPGLMRACSDVNNAARYDVPPPLTREDYEEETVAVGDHREITGSSGALLPPSDKKDQPDTLGGMQMNLSQAIQRLKPDLRIMEIMGIRMIANRAFILSMQYITEPKMIELMASQDEIRKFGITKLFKYTPGMIRQGINFHCTGLSESVEKAQNIDKLVKYTEMTSKIPPMQMITNYQGIGKQIALWMGLENVEDMVKIDPFDPLAQQPVQQPVPGQPGQGSGLPPEVLQRISQGLAGSQPRV